LIGQLVSQWIVCSVSHLVDLWVDSNLFGITMNIYVNAFTLLCEIQPVCVCIQSMKRKKRDAIATCGRGGFLALTAA